MSEDVQQHLKYLKTRSDNNFISSENVFQKQRKDEDFSDNNELRWEFITEVKKKQQLYDKKRTTNGRGEVEAQCYKDLILHEKWCNITRW